VWKFKSKSLDKLDKLIELSCATQSVWTPGTQNPLATYTERSSQELFKFGVKHLG